MFKEMTTQKLIGICVIAILALNYLGGESKKGFDKSVLEAIENNKDEVRKILGASGPAAEAPPTPEQQDPEEEFKKVLADKADVEIGNTPVFGNKNSKIMIVVFSDFQCPFSQRGAATVMTLTDKYGNDVSFVYKNLPLSFHPEALPSAKSALAAGKQGKFYEYHDKLFENQQALGEDLYIMIANDLGLDINKFKTDRESKEVADQIENDKAQAQKLGFNGTPGFTLNGVKILGAYPVEHFEKIITALNLN